MSFNRARQYVKNITGAGGGGPAPGGTVLWGPDFGGVSGDHLNSDSTVSLSDLNLTGNLSDSISEQLTQLDIVYNDIVQATGSISGELLLEYNMSDTSSVDPGTLLIDAYNLNESSTSALDALLIDAYNLNMSSTIALYSTYVDYTGYANANVSTTGWTSPSNALGNTTSTSAVLTAASSGIGGITSNTTNGTMVVAFADPNTTVTAHTLNSGITISVERDIVSGGTLPIGQAVNISWDVSVDAGSSWTTISTDTATVSKSTISLDITSLVGTDYTKINNLQVRATGSVTSGTGLGATMTANFYRTWVNFNATKVY